MRAETQYPDCLPYRRKQTQIWDRLTAEEIADQIKETVNHKRKIPIKFLRMQEAGDFRNQADVTKTSHLAGLLRGVVTVYTYTARRDLDFSRISSNLIVNGSGFMVTNNFQVVNEFRPGPQCRGIKGGGCYGCKLCKSRGGKVIQELLRGGKLKTSANSDIDTTEHGGVPEIDLAGGLLQPKTSAKRTRKTTGKKTRRYADGSPMIDFGGLK